jgi:DNA-binding transcriptional LysR family regulator
MLRQVTIRHAEYFVAAVEAGSMTGAALQLHVSQSAVSLAIAELERIAGGALFVRRKARGLLLTEVGTEFLPSARELIAKADEVQAIASTIGNQVAGRLVVGCFSVVSPFVIPQLLESFQAEYPSVELDFIEGSDSELYTELATGACEVALLYDLGTPYMLQTKVIRRAVPHVIMSSQHPLAAKSEIRLADLEDHPMIMLGASSMDLYFRRIFAQGGHFPIVRYHSSNYELVRSLVARDFGYSLLIDQPAIDTSYEGRPIVARQLRGNPLSVDLVVAHPSGARLSRRATAFTEHCRETLSSDVELSARQR